MQFFHLQFPFIDRVLFKDESSILCQGNRLSLRDFYISKYGQTWYERNFNAELVDDKSRRKYHKDLAKALGPYKEGDSFDCFFKKYMKPYKNEISQETLDMVRDAFNSNNTYHGMLSTLANNDCHVFHKWLRRYFSKKLIIDGEDDWFISRTHPYFSKLKVRKVSTITMKPLPLFGGGGGGGGGRKQNKRISASMASKEGLVLRFGIQTMDED